jgi:predicted signal transduction protein with EAL and GGDEF domain
MDFVSPDDGVFLSTMPATRSQRWLALAVVLIATGRIYGLMAVSVVLLVLLIELGRLYGQLVDKQKELRRLSVADPLTAIANRRSFDEALQREWRQTLTDRTTLALLLIDVDFFKPFNDGYGHLVGDRCLRLVAEVLSGSARRAGETIARLRRRRVRNPAAPHGCGARIRAGAASLQTRW